MSRIVSSEHGAPGLVVCTREGVIVWTGPLVNIGDAPEFDRKRCPDPTFQAVI